MTTLLYNPMTNTLILLYPCKQTSDPNDHDLWSIRSLKECGWIVIGKL